MQDTVLTPTDFVALFNQTLEVAYPIIVIEGEVANFRVSRGKWVYFDIKDEFSSLRVFGTTFMLQYPVEDGMKIRLTAQPRLHPQYNFSLNMMHVAPLGEGSIKRASDLLKAKLEAEGLFDPSRKRSLPYPPERIALVTSNEAAAYSDFIKVLGARWPLADIRLVNVRVQGDQAAAEIAAAIHHCNQSPSTSDVIVVIRGGGSADDLLAFQEENLVRAIAESRIPTLVAIGHERDISLAELAADVRASTPSNAAELLAPDRRDVLRAHQDTLQGARAALKAAITQAHETLRINRLAIATSLQRAVAREVAYLEHQKVLLTAVNPTAVLQRGYALVFNKDGAVRRGSDLRTGDTVTLRFADRERSAEVIG